MGWRSQWGGCFEAQHSCQRSCKKILIWLVTKGRQPSTENLWPLMVMIYLCTFKNSDKGDCSSLWAERATCSASLRASANYLSTPFGSSPQETGHRSKIPWVYINSGLKNTCSFCLVAYNTNCHSHIAKVFDLNSSSKASCTFCHGSRQKMDPLVLGFIQIIHCSALEYLLKACLNSTSLPSAAVVRNADGGLEVVF